MGLRLGRLQVLRDSIPSGYCNIPQAGAPKHYPKGRGGALQFIQDMVSGRNPEKAEATRTGMFVKVSHSRLETLLWSTEKFDNTIGALLNGNPPDETLIALLLSYPNLSQTKTSSKLREIADNDVALYYDILTKMTDVNQMFLDFSLAVDKTILGLMKANAQEPGSSADEVTEFYSFAERLKSSLPGIIPSEFQDLHSFSLLINTLKRNLAYAEKS